MKHDQDSNLAMYSCKDIKVAADTHINFIDHCTEECSHFLGEALP